MRIGTIGTSMIVNLFAEAVALTEGAACVAAYSRSADSGREFARKHGIRRVYTDLDEMLKDPEVNVVYVGSPNSMHCEQTIRALEAGNHVICEKPFASNAKEAGMMIRLAREKGLYLFEAITVVHSPEYQILRQKIEEIAPVRMVQCKYAKYSGKYDQLKNGELPNIFNPEFSGGALMDLNVYNIHFVTGLFGFPEEIRYTAGCHENGIDLEGIAVLTYPELLCSCMAAKNVHSKNDIQIHGEKGYIYMPGGTSGKSGFTIYKESGAETIHIEEDINPLYYEVRAFQDIYQRGALEECYRLLDHTEQVMEVLDRARASAGICFPADKHW